MAAIRERLFTYRSYTPIPFLVLMIAFAKPTAVSLAVGGCVALLGELTRFWGVAYAGSLTRVTGNVGAPAVIVAGPFAHVRNPLYIGNIMMYLGIGVMANALVPWLPTVAFVFFVWQYSTIVSLEEEFLQKEFGASYLEFKKNVPRFLPRLVGYRHPVQEAQKPSWSEALKSETRTLQALMLVVLAVLVLWYRG